MEMGMVMTTLWLILFIVLVFAPFPLLLRGNARKYWTITMVGFGTWLGAMEAICAWWTPEKQTLSQHIWDVFNSQDPWRGWVILGSFLAGWVCLVLHLCWKAITRKK